MHNDDPKLTAYALGELAPPERAEIEALLQNDPAAAQEVEEMRELAALVRRHLSTEDAPPLAPQQRDDILTEMKEPRVVVMPRGQAGGRPRRVWMPLAIAACAALLAGSGVLYYEEHKPRATYLVEQKTVSEPEQLGAFFASDPTGNKEAPEPAAATSGLRDLAPTATAPAPPVTLGLSDLDSDGRELQKQLRNADAPAATAATTKSGSGTLMLGFGNAYTGATVVNGGTLDLSAKDGATPLPAPVPSTPNLYFGTDRQAGGGARAPQSLAPAPRANTAPVDQLSLGDDALKLKYDSTARGLADHKPKNANEEKSKALAGEGLAAGAKPGAVASSSNGTVSGVPAPEAVGANSLNGWGLRKAQAAGDSAGAVDQRKDVALLPAVKGEKSALALDRPELNGPLPATPRAPTAPAPIAPFAPVAPALAAPAPAAAPVAEPARRTALASTARAAASVKDESRAKLPVAAATPVPLRLTAGTTELFSEATPDQAKNSPVYVRGQQAVPGEMIPQSIATRAGGMARAKADPNAGATQPARPRPDGLKPNFDTGLAGAPDGGFSTFSGRLTKTAQPADGPKENQITLGSITVGPKFADAKAVQDAELPIKNLDQPVADKLTTDSYDAVTDNPFLQVLVRGNETSTFSIDVDTASYSNVRRLLTAGERPPKGAVRIEELVNYFKYDYPAPKAGDPMAVSLDVAGCPWTPEHRLLRVGLKARELDPETRQDANLIFLLDVSGSMAPENRLPLVKKSLRLLIEKLGTNDTVGIVVYAGASGVVLEPTNDKEAMLAALDKLSAGGSTNGASGIQLAYEQAATRFAKGRVNRVILATDGDFNVGITNQSDLIDLIKKKAAGGVYLTILGVGHGNLKDSTMEKLADKGNGNYAYIDTIAEGRKVLVEQMAGTLVTMAKDVKVQIEFNPAQVGAYRLIGYENRLLAKEDFNDDTKDAGEIGAGHTVTALYEIVPAGQPIPGDRETTQIDPLKYQPNPTTPGNKLAPANVDAPRYLGRDKAAELADTTAPVNELLTLKLRWKAPDGDVSTKREFPLTDAGLPLDKSAKDFRWAAAVAEFGMMLRDSPYKGQATWSGVRELAIQGQGKNADSHRIEFLDLIEKAEAVVK